MSKTNAQLHFFLGANTPQGFVSRFDQIIDERAGRHCYIIKGGPGSGKSTLMKDFAAQAEALGLRPEYFHCSSDLASLDAVATEGLGYVILDGTPPHAVEPRFPGAFETLVPVGDCWDEEFLQTHRGEILALCDENRKCHELCRRYLAAAGSLLGDVGRMAQEYVFSDKVAAHARMIARREFGRRAAVPGSERVRFLSAVTDRGLYCFTGTINALCEKLYVIDDEYGAASRMLLSALRKLALDAGLDIISCYCPMAPYEKLEHLLIPSLRLGFVTSNRHHPFSCARFRTIHARRFMDMEGIAGKKPRVRFTVRAATELLNEAAKCMAQAKALHDDIEKYYISSMDYEKVSALGRRINEALRSGK